MDVVTTMKSASGPVLWARKRVRDRSFPTRVVKGAAKDVGITVDRRLRRSLARWIRDDLVDLLCDVTPNRAAARVVQLSSSEQVEIGSLGDLNEFVGALAKQLLRELPADLRLHALGQTVRDGFSSSGEIGQVDFSRLPPSTASFLEARMGSDPREARALAELLLVDGSVDPSSGSRLAVVSTDVVDAIRE